MKRLGVWLLATMLFCLLLPAVGQAEEITYTGVVNTKSLHLRKEPNASAKVLNNYARGKEVTILENDGTWCLVQIGTKTTGYMMTKYLKASEGEPLYSVLTKNLTKEQAEELVRTYGGEIIAG